MAAIIAIGAFAVVLLLVIVVSNLSGGRTAGVREHLRRTVAASSSTTEATTSVEEAGPAARRQDFMPTLTRLLMGRRITEQLYTELAAAGVPIRPSEFLAICAVSVIVFQAIASIIAKNLLGNFLFFIIAIAIPFGVLKSLQARRRVAFNEQIIDAMMLIASSLRSGFSFLRAMQMVSQEMPPPISQEFERVINEVNVGRSMEDSLRSVVARVKSYDFDLAVTAVLIQHQVGGNLADVLESIAATIRERLTIIGEMNALTAEGKISGLLLTLLPIGLGFIIAAINPEYLQILIQEKLGQIMIVGAIVMQIVGYAIIKKMLVLDI